MRQIVILCSYLDDGLKLIQILGSVIYGWWAWLFFSAVFPSTAICWIRRCNVAFKWVMQFNVVFSSDSTGSLIVRMTPGRKVLLLWDHSRSSTVTTRYFQDQRTIGYLCFFLIFHQFLPEICCVLPWSSPKRQAEKNWRWESSISAVEKFVLWRPIIKSKLSLFFLILPLRWAGRVLNRYSYWPHAPRGPILSKSACLLLSTLQLHCSETFSSDLSL